MGMILFAALQSICGAEDPVPAEKPDKPISLAKWSQSLQKDVGKVLPGKTKAEHDVVVSEHLAWFKENHSSAFVEFSVKVTGVRWDNGVAHISTTGEIPVNPRAIIVLSTRGEPFAVTMDQVTATALRRGMPLKVTAKLFLSREGMRFRTDKTTNLMLPLWQRFYRVENDRLDCNLGQYYSGDCKYEIGGQNYPGAWTDPAPAEDDK